jgi:phenylacetate-CoA ligase
VAWYMRSYDARIVCCMAATAALRARAPIGDEMRGVQGILGSFHDLVAVRAVQPLHRTYRLVRSSMRPVMLAFNDGMRVRRAAAHWTAEQQREWVLRRLQHEVRRAARETPYYRELFARVGFEPKADFDFADFARLPVLERATVRAQQASLVSSAVPEGQLTRDATGGSTGTPTEIWMGPEERGWRESGIEFFMRRIGLPVGSRTALLWGHHLDPVKRQGLHDSMHDWKDNVRWFDCLRLSPSLLELYHRELQQWRPQCVVAYASAVAALAEAVRGRSSRPNYPTRCFVTGAEKLLPHERALVEEVFGRPVHERYGSRDVGLIGFQTDPARSRDYEIDWSNVLVEPETTDGVSSILVTKLHADAMPMLRYRIGDIGHFPSGSAPGHPALTLHDVIGRDTDRIWLPDGRWVHGLAFPHLMKDHPVRDFQVVQRRDLSVEIRVVARTDFTGESRSEILEKARSNLSGVPVDLLLVDDIPRLKSNKRRPVISEASPRSSEGAA